jgi:hypothetical protein
MARGIGPGEGLELYDKNAGNIFKERKHEEEFVRTKQNKTGRGTPALAF